MPPSLLLCGRSRRRPPVQTAADVTKRPSIPTLVLRVVKWVCGSLLKRSRGSMKSFITRLRLSTSCKQLHQSIFTQVLYLSRPWHIFEAIVLYLLLVLLLELLNLHSNTLSEGNVVLFYSTTSIQQQGLVIILQVDISHSKHLITLLKSSVQHYIKQLSNMTFWVLLLFNK